MALSNEVVDKLLDLVISKIFETHPAFNNLIDALLNGEDVMLAKTKEVSRSLENAASKNR